MSEEKLTVAELLARAEKRGEGATRSDRPRRRRRSLEDGGVFVAGSLLWGMAVDGFRPDRFDVTGAVVLSAALVCLLLPISKGSTWGWGSPAVVGLLVAGVGCLRGLQTRTGAAAVAIQV